MNETPVILAQKQATPLPVQPVPKAVPINPAVTAPPPPPPPSPTQTVPTVGTGRTIGELPFNSFDLGVIAGITILVALIALIPKSLITRHLVSRRATPSAAGMAAWSAWFFIVVTAVVILAGTLGHLWLTLLFVVPGGAALFLLLVLTVILFARAQHTHR